MTQYIRYIIAILMLFVFSTGCKKEKTLSPTNLDENYLVVKDNPNDPVDHQIFLFYQETGIPGFYSDTVSKKQVGVSSNGVPKYSYQLLTLAYTPIGKSTYTRTLIEDKQLIPPLLDLLKSAVLPFVPEGAFMPSILFLDSFELETPRYGPAVSDGWEAYHGFNTVAIKIRDVTAMNAEEKKDYALSILTGIAAKRMIIVQSNKLQKEFYSISRDLMMPQIQMDIYTSFPMEFFYPVLPAPETMGFMHYLPYVMKFDVFEFNYNNAPREEDDLRMFLMAVLRYTEQDFLAQYPDQPLLIQKFRAMQGLATSIGLQLP